MLPFPKRPPAPHEYDLGTGDYEAYQPYAAAPQRQPVFHRSAPAHQSYRQPPQEFTPYASVQVAPHVHNDMRMMGHAPPPHSLAPVAMSQVSSTSSYRPQETVVLRGRPDLRWGVTLALAGALCGGLLGVAMHAGKADRAAHASAAAQVQEPVAVAPQPVVVPQPVVAPQPVVVAPQPAVAPQPVAAPQAPVVIAPQPVVAPQPPAPPPNAYAVRAPAPPPAAPAHAPSHPAHKAGHATKHQVAAAPPPAPPKTSGQRLDLASKVQPPPAPEKGGVSDAVRLLRDATKDTDNTLGGSR